jgi:hypothetical protein
MVPIARSWIAAVLVFTSGGIATAQEPSPASFRAPASSVSIHQRDLILGGQGICVFEFAVDGQGLAAPIEDLVFAVRVVGPDGKDLGVGRVALKEELGGARAYWYAIARLEGQDIPALMEFVGDAGSSPLCLEGTALVFESAIGKQSGRVVDLVRHGQLRYAPQRLVKVRIGR